MREHITCHMGSHLPPDSSEHAPPPLTPAKQIGQYLFTYHKRIKD